MEKAQGSIEIINSKNIKINLPRLDADGAVDYKTRVVPIEEWKNVTKERLILLPKAVHCIKSVFAEEGLAIGEYEIYLFGSVARGQAVGSADRCFNNSDIDLVVCMKNTAFKSSLNFKLQAVIEKINFTDISDIEINVTTPFDNFDKVYSIKLV